MVRLEANPTPSLLVWAREKAGYSVEQASKRASIKSERLAAWEAGTQKPSFAQLRKLAEIYRRPVALFYLDEPPVRFEAMHDFRRGSSELAGVVASPELSFEIRRAYDRREWALELLTDIGETPADFTTQIRLRSNTEEAATQLRHALAITLDKQQAWKSESDAFRGWRSVLERAGVMTFQATEIQTAEARGFAIQAHPLPVVVVNIKDARRGRIFTMMHELAHIALGDGGICDLHDTDKADDTETYCNRVAGAILFPREALIDSDVVREHPRGVSEWTPQEIEQISRRFGGSREAALVRLLTLGLTTWSFYKKRRAELLKEWASLRREQTGFAPPHQVALASAGQMFAGIVVESFNRDKITASDVADYLQVRLKHLAEIQRDFSAPNT
jgi:Zn-dependent peptidase ImmA (M78 family)/transcriptional regulator with XRE-family HTH domain